MICETDFTASVGFTRRLRLSQVCPFNMTSQLASGSLAACVCLRSPSGHLGFRGRLGPSPAGQPVSAHSLTRRKRSLTPLSSWARALPAHVCWCAGLFQSEPAQFGCISCDKLGSFYQQFAGRTSCTIHLLSRHFFNTNRRFVR
jgi:hypothetical protein